MSEMRQRTAEELKEIQDELRSTIEESRSLVTRHILHVSDDAITELLALRTDYAEAVRIRERLAARRQAMADERGYWQEHGIEESGEPVEVFVSPTLHSVRRVSQDGDITTLLQALQHERQTAEARLGEAAATIAVLVETIDAIADWKAPADADVYADFIRRNLPVLVTQQRERTVWLEEGADLLKAYFKSNPPLVYGQSWLEKEPKAP